MKKTLFFAGALALASAAQAGCYTVLGPKGQVLSQTSTPPVDMAYQLHQTVPYKYGSGSALVFGVADGDCGPEADFDEVLHPTNIVYQQPKAQRAVKARKAKKARRRAVRRQH